MTLLGDRVLPAIRARVDGFERERGEYGRVGMRGEEKVRATVSAAENCRFFR